MKRFIFQQICTNTRDGVIEADTKEEALAKYNDPKAYSRISWGEEQPLDTELQWVGEKSEDGLSVIQDWNIENGEFPEDE